MGDDSLGHEKIMTNLFEGDRTEERIPYRPLGAVSDFVVNKLSEYLECIRAGKLDVTGLANDCDHLVADLFSAGELSSAINNPHKLNLAMLDANMMFSGIAHSGGLPAPHLTQLVNELAIAVDQPPTMTYENYVIDNPSKDKRTFTTGEVGSTESDFCEGHRLIETEHFDPSIEVLRETIDILYSRGREGVKGAIDRLDYVKQHLEKLIEYMKVIGWKMPREHFAIFRHYLNKNPITGHKGASAAFTSGIPIIGILFGGENLPKEYYDFLQENEIYFPRKGRAGIRQSRELADNGLSITALYNASEKPSQMAPYLEDINQSLRLFRGIHYAATKHQIPQAISNKLPGTSGEPSPGEFLRGMMKIRYLPNDSRQI